MKKIKAILVDDEKSGISTLSRLLNQHCPQIEIIKTYQSSLEALEGIPTYQPDLLFLDIEMPHLNGLELLKQLHSKMSNAYDLIFVTAHVKYAVQAFKLHALHYLLKPVDDDKLIEAVKRVKPKDSVNVFSDQIKAALEDLGDLNINHQTSIGFRDGRKLIYEKIANIGYCKSNGNDSYI